MGYNTPVMILNDAMSNLKTDADVGRKMYEAMLLSSRPEYRNRGVDFSIGNHCNGGMVLPSRHADETRLIAVGGNYMTDIGSVWGASMDDPEALCRALAEKLGFRLVKKAGAK